MSLLQQLLGFLGIGGSRRRRRRPPTSAAVLRRSGLVRCQQCRATVRLGTLRCPQCGTRTIESLPKLPSTAVAGLTDLQQEILAATLDGEEQTIHVVPPKGSDEGEVKAGAQRMSGDDVLFAVERLWQKGFVEPTDDASFRPTEKGRNAIAE